MWSVRLDLYCAEINMWHILEQLSSLSIHLRLHVGFIYSQIAASVLSYEKQQPGGMLNFHKTITAS